MILSLASVGTLGPAPLVLAVLAMLGYVAAALPLQRLESLAVPGLMLGLMLHGLLLALDIGGAGRDVPGARLGFGPVLSLTVWLTVSVHAVESRLLPLPAVRRVLAAAGVGAVLLAWAFPGEARPMASPWAPMHWLLGVGAYGLFGAAVLHAAMLDTAERQMRLRATPGQGPLGMPLLRLERLTFRFVEAGFVVLTLALVLGFATAAGWRFDHKIVFSLLAWGVFAALLTGRLLRGWRGQRATRWLYLGAVLLLLAYVGSRFVLEVVLGRGA